DTGWRTEKTSFENLRGQGFFFPDNIRSPALVFPNSPVTATTSPSLAPSLRRIPPDSANPNPIQSITSSSVSLVSPPSILHPYSLAPLLRADAISFTLDSLTGGGIPRDTKSPRGWTPFAAKSLTVATTAFLAACPRVMPRGTFVLPTCMSVFNNTSLSTEFGNAAKSTSYSCRSFGPE